MSHNNPQPVKKKKKKKRKKNEKQLFSLYLYKSKSGMPGFNPLSPSIHMQTLPTDLHTFP